MPPAHTCLLSALRRLGPADDSRWSGGNDSACCLRNIVSFLYQARLKLHRKPSPFRERQEEGTSKASIGNELYAHIPTDWKFLRKIRGCRFFLWDLVHYANFKDLLWSLLEKFLLMSMSFRKKQAKKTVLSYAHFLPVATKHRYSHQTLKNSKKSQDPKKQNICALYCILTLWREGLKRCRTSLFLPKQNGTLTDSYFKNQTCTRLHPASWPHDLTRCRTYFFPSETERHADGQLFCPEKIRHALYCPPDFHARTQFIPSETETEQSAGGPAILSREKNQTCTILHP